MMAVKCVVCHRVRSDGEKWLLSKETNYIHGIGNEFLTFINSTLPDDVPRPTGVTDLCGIPCATVQLGSWGNRYKVAKA